MAFCTVVGCWRRACGVDGVVCWERMVEARVLGGYCGEEYGIGGGNDGGGGGVGGAGGVCEVVGKGKE